VTEMSVTLADEQSFAVPTCSRWRRWCGRSGAETDADVSDGAEDLPGDRAGGHAQTLQRAVGLDDATFAGRPAQGAAFIFANKHRDRIKNIILDGTGVWVLAKRWRKAGSPGRWAAMRQVIAGAGSPHDAPGRHRSQRRVQKAWYER